MTGAFLFDKTGLWILSESFTSEMLAGLGPRGPSLPFTLWQASPTGRCPGQEYKKYFCKWRITILFFPGRMKMFLRLPEAFAGLIGWRRRAAGPRQYKVALWRASQCRLCPWRAPAAAAPLPPARGWTGFLRPFPGSGAEAGEKRARGWRIWPLAPGAVGGSGRRRGRAGDVTMGATQGSAGSEPLEPAGGAEQVGSLPCAHRAPPPAGLARGHPRPGRGSVPPAGTPPRQGAEEGLRGGAGSHHGAAGRGLWGGPRAGGWHRVRSACVYVTHTYRCWRVFQTCLMYLWPLRGCRLRARPGPPALQAEEPFVRGGRLG